MKFHDRLDTEVERYHAVSGLAVAGAILAVLSALVMIEPRARLVWALPAAGIIVNAWALARIARLEPALAGRKLALTGLFVSILFAVAAPTAEFTSRYLLRREARQVADTWFRLLAEGHPEQAYQLVLGLKARQPLDDKLWDFYRSQSRYREGLQEYVAPSTRPGAPAIVRTLLALGPRARARYYRTASERHLSNKDIIFLVYAVTYDNEEGEKTTFWVGLELHRLKLSSGEAHWRLAQVLRASWFPDVRRPKPAPVR